MKYLSSFILSACLFLLSCNPGTENKETNTVGKISIAEKPFGSFNNESVTEYTLTNADGMMISILNYGGTVTKIITKDKTGKEGNVILGYDSLAGYLQKGNPYFGCLVGRYGNRIAKGKFTLDSVTYTLAANNNGQSLHGGLKGFDKVIDIAGGFKALKATEKLQLTEYVCPSTLL